MKHGPIALIDENMPVVIVAPQDAVYSKVLSNIQEVKARHGRIIAVVTEGNGDLSKMVDHMIPIPRTSGMLTPILATVRNLAKSVTVE
jgi:glucosamine--fructose-6-phosphate aminotransferase (isomerizing)